MKSDTYSWRARVLPVYLTVASVVLAIAAMLPEGLRLPLGGAAALVFVPLAFLASQVGADFGKRIEKRLWLQWGGPPTSRLLRHANREFNHVTRERVHEKLRACGLHVPTQEEEEQDPVAADAHYEACTEELIRRTRDEKRFPLVFKGLTEYGFRRNLLGLKPIGLPVTAMALLACGLGVLRSWEPSAPPGVAIVAGLLVFVLFACWLFWVTKNTVHLAANRYARHLLEAALNLE